MPAPADFWSSLFTLPTLVVAVVVALLTFGLNRLGNRLDSKSRDGQTKPSRRNARHGRRFLSQLAKRDPSYQGPQRWTLSFNSSLDVYEVENHGPDAVHDLRIDFYDASKTQQSGLNPTIRFGLYPVGVPLAMPLGASSRINGFGMAIRWDDQYGTDQFDKILIKDARRI